MSLYLIPRAKFSAQGSTVGSRPTASAARGVTSDVSFSGTARKNVIITVALITVHRAERQASRALHTASI